MHDGWKIVVQREPRFERRVLTRRERMYVSLNKRGEIVMNGRAFDEIGPTANVTLMYDAERRAIGVKRPVGKDRHFFPVRRYGRGQRMHIVRAAKLLEQFGITIERTRVFEDISVEVFEGEPMLLLELDSTSEL
jgi:hypothetical protein